MLCCYICTFDVMGWFWSTVELARTCIGTPYYLSPEICEARPYNNKRLHSVMAATYKLSFALHYDTRIAADFSGQPW